MSEEQEYDLLLPKLPFDILGEAMEEFNLKLIQEKTEVGHFVLRGSREEVEKAKDFIYEKLKETVEKLGGEV
ncbi:MAG: hypothetical protein SVM80_07145 [Halobacteriota archaeon]|nr:hypothetical protein [Halobacteriota archaeon]